VQQATNSADDDGLTPGCTGTPVSAPEAHVEELIGVLGQVIRRVKWWDSVGAPPMPRLQVDILGQLRDGEPRRVTTLAECLAVDLSVLSRAAAAMIEAGLVDRTRDPEDGRAFLVTITRAGTEALASVRARRHARIGQFLSAFLPDQIATATEVLRALATGMGPPRPNPRPQAPPPGAHP
jgi:DNA-binding MarR family transcriptional regulator